MKNITDIVKYITRNPFSVDKEKLVTDIKSDEESKAVFHKLKIAWALFSSTKHMESYEIEKSYQSLQKKMVAADRKAKGGNIFNLLKLVAVVVVAAGIPLFFYLNKPEEVEAPAREIRFTSVVADYGQISKIILPDSSIVWLNSGTTLSYNNGYSIDNRDLVLTGQAYFDVTRNENIPLTVACSDIKVKVLGTKFDVNAYPDDDKINVVLESGSVELSHATNKAIHAKMIPGDVAQFNVSSNQLDIEHEETQDLTSWKEGYLIFKDTPMNQVIEKLERKFDVEIIATNPDVNKSLLNARFKEEKLQDILDYIEFSCLIKHKYSQNEKTDKTIIEFY